MSGLESTPSQRWLARLSFVLAGLAIVILVVFAGLKSLAILAVGLAPRGRPGIPAPKPPKDWARLRYLAGIPKTARPRPMTGNGRHTGTAPSSYRGHCAQITALSGGNDGQEKEEEGRA